VPDILRLNGPAPCPGCGDRLVNCVRCQWGMLPGGDYEIGDGVKWLLDARGTPVPPFTLREDPRLGHRWNCGDPQFRNVIALDLNMWVDGYPTRCPKCGTEVVGSAAVVRDGVFREILVLTQAERDRILGPSVGKASIVIVRDDGSFWPRDDWDDHTVHWHG
jgi:hypothetical protein